MKTLVRETSIECYHSLELSDQQKDVMTAIRVMGQSCIADIAEHLHWQKSTVSGRMNELKKFGVIIMTGKQPSLTTHIMSEFWRLKEYRETLF